MTFMYSTCKVRYIDIFPRRTCKETSSELYTVVGHLGAAVACTVLYMHA